MRIPASFSRSLAAILLSLAFLPAAAQRADHLLEEGWQFRRGDSLDWEDVRIPHDWAIEGPFDMSNDLQSVAVVQDGETKATLKTGRTGGLPYVGRGFYRRTFTVEEGMDAILLFEGAMSRARVLVNGREACFWPYGYSAFHCDVTPLLAGPGEENLLEVELENLDQSSRWYPGAGLYRPVHLITVPHVHVPVWGTFVTTPLVEESSAQVHLETRIDNLEEGSEVVLITKVLDRDGREVARTDECRSVGAGQAFAQDLVVETPELWSPETPVLYTAVSEILVDGRTVDRCETSFGIRTVEFVPGRGFLLNGKPRKFRGVCNHHDLGPLGSAVNESAIRYRLSLLKDMGCDAIRTTHNMPSSELVRLCDRMGFMLVVEPFDEWDVAKCRNGYHKYFDEWSERDMVNMLHRFRNHPSVVLWSIGNEVPTQCSPDGYRVASYLRDICHREDPTRLVTCGMDRVDCVLDNGFAAAVDIPGLNYRTYRYREAFERLPQGMILGSETASCVSSRGVYHLPASLTFSRVSEDHQCSSYDTDACSWSNIPDIDFALAEDYGWTLGQFVWTGFDYLGEPSPYSTDSWPNHSSMFGIIDLACIPKDRFYLYRSIWNTESPTLHVLPHWSWEDGQRVPVFAYTSYPSAELFVNGVSQGIRSKAVPDEPCSGVQNDPGQMERYRLMWPDVTFRKGEITVVAYDADGRAASSETVRTAGRPHHLVAETVPGESLAADGKDLMFVRISVVDRDGNVCPRADNLVRLSVRGRGSYCASANGDPTCLDSFGLPKMHCFSGMMTTIVRASDKAGMVTLMARSKGLRPAAVSFRSVQAEK